MEARAPAAALVATFRDVTACREAEAALQQSEAWSLPRPQLAHVAEHLIRAAGEITQDDVVIIGSQAILGQFRGAHHLHRIGANGAGIRL